MDSRLVGHVTMSKWREHDNYECNYCPYATLDEEAMLRHLQLRHVIKAPVSPILVANSAGQEVPPAETMYLVKWAPPPSEEEMPDEHV